MAGDYRRRERLVMPINDSVTREGREDEEGCAFLSNGNLRTMVTNLQDVLRTIALLMATREFDS
jgi:hypothetical protein